MIDFGNMNISRKIGYLLTSALPPVTAAVHLCKRATSPRKTFIITVSEITYDCGIHLKVFCLAHPWNTQL